MARWRHSSRRRRWKPRSRAGRARSPAPPHPRHRIEGCWCWGRRDEMESARDRSKGKLDWKIDVLGTRPGGELPSNSPLLAALRAADDYVGNQSRIERSSTDANIPLSSGIDAISIGAGGTGGGAHSLQEWYEPSGREMGLKRALLTLLGISGIAEGTP